jgi:hypothetical protein
VYVSELVEAVQDLHVSVIYSRNALKSYWMKSESRKSRKAPSLWQWRWWSRNVVFFNATWKLGTIIIVISSESSTGDGILYLVQWLGYELENWGNVVQFLAHASNFIFFSKASKWVLGPTQPSGQCIVVLYSRGHRVRLITHIHIA